MTFSVSQPSDAEASARASAGAAVGQFYLDVSHRQLHCLNERARQLKREGLPLTPDVLPMQKLYTLEGAEVHADDLPLIRAWRSGKAEEATFVWCREGVVPHHVSWSAAPLWKGKEKIVGVTGAVICAPPEPDWQILAGLAHDIRNPLQALRMLVTVLESTPFLDTAKQQAILDRIRSAAERAGLIGLDLLEWCRGPVQGGRRVTREWFLLQPFLLALLNEQSAEAQRKNLQLVSQLDDVLNWEIQTDRVRMGRLLANLLANAVRYTPAGRVELVAQWRDSGEGKKLALTIVDTGAGISPEEQESIFQPFERGRAGKEGDSGGSGVGLAVADRLVEELGLELEVYSEYGKGSAFHLIVPVTVLRKS